jgi:hypothetical protein
MLMVCLCITTWNRFLVLIFMMRSFAPPCLIYSLSFPTSYTLSTNTQSTTRVLPCNAAENSVTPIQTQSEKGRDLLGVGLTSMACRPYSTMFIQKQSFSISALFSVTFTNPGISYLSTVFKQAQFRKIMRREVLGYNLLILTTRN